jgi:acetoin utilization deacetylase AcuC-like enzyme
MSSVLPRRQFLRTFAAGIGSVAIMPQGWGRVEAAEQPPAKKSTALVCDQVCTCHLTGPDAPESPRRYDAVLGGLAQGGYLPQMKTFKPRPATDEEIRLCHSDSYLALARREIESGATRLSTGDTRICPDSMKAALYAAGAACVAVDTVLAGDAKNAFCLTRPPGHHATGDRGMGFCIFNNVGIAARYAQKRYGVGKVLIIDWDVHHGNGTQDIFYEDPSVFFFSTHQSPWYPWTGAAEETGRGKGLGTTLNCPLAEGAGRKEFLQAFEGQLLPAMQRFRPELVLLSAGFDARIDDPLGKLLLTDEDYVDLTTLVLELASQHAGGRLVSVLEGGYNLPGLASAAAAHCGRLVQS